MPFSKSAVAENPEDLADFLQASFALEQAAAILDLMRAVQTVANALDLFAEQWPHMKKAWDNAISSVNPSMKLLAIEFLRKSAPMLVMRGERETLKDRAEVAGTIAQHQQNPFLKAAIAYFSAIALMQFREYNLALPLLERANAELPSDFEDPTRSEVLTALGATYLGLGRELEAEKTFEELSLLTFLKYYSANPNSSLEALKAQSLDQMHSGTGIVALLSRPHQTISDPSLLSGPPAFFRRT